MPGAISTVPPGHASSLAGRVERRLVVEDHASDSEVVLATVGRSAPVRPKARQSRIGGGVPGRSAVERRQRGPPLGPTIQRQRVTDTSAVSLLCALARRHRAGSSDLVGHRTRGGELEPAAGPARPCALVCR
jgi:hypothetical protein